MSTPAPRRRLLLVAGLAAIALNVSGPAFFGPGGPEPVDPNAKSYRLDNSKLNSPGAGVSYRNSKNEDDLAKDGAPWGSTVLGVDEGDGWLKVGDKYLPTNSNGVQILIEAVDEEGNEDWKDEAWRRQQERLTQRRARASPDYKMSSEEQLIRKRKQAVWKMMSTRSSEGLLGETDDDGRVVRVTLSKPLGINFMEVNPSSPCGALIGAMSEGMAASMSNELEVGDVLVAVNNQVVQGKPMDEALQPIIDTEGEMELAFFRADLDAR